MQGPKEYREGTGGVTGGEGDGVADRLAALPVITINNYENIVEAYHEAIEEAERTLIAAEANNVEYWFGCAASELIIIYKQFILALDVAIDKSQAEDSARVMNPYEIVFNGYLKNERYKYNRALINIYSDLSRRYLNGIGVDANH